MPGIQRFDQRVLIDGRAAANIDDVSAFREQRHAVCVQDVHRVAHRGERHEEKVSLGQELIELRDGMNGVKVRVRAAAAADAGQARGMERAHAAGKFRADVARAKARDARAVERVDAAREHAPIALADDLGVFHLAAQQHQRDHDRMLGDRRAVSARGVRQQAVGILIQVVAAEVVHARPAARVPLEIACARDNALGRMAVEDRAVVHIALRRLGRGEEDDVVAAARGGVAQRLFVCRSQEVDDDADFFIFCCGKRGAHRGVHHAEKRDGKFVPDGVQHDRADRAAGGNDHLNGEFPQKCNILICVFQYGFYQSLAAKGDSKTKYIKIDGVGDVNEVSRRIFDALDR